MDREKAHAKRDERHGPQVPKSDHVCFFFLNKKAHAKRDERNGPHVPKSDHVCVCV